MAIGTGTIDGVRRPAGTGLRPGALIGVLLLAVGLLAGVLLDRSLVGVGTPPVGGARTAVIAPPTPVLSLRDDYATRHLPELAALKPVYVMGRNLEGTSPLSGDTPVYMAGRNLKGTAPIPKP